MKKFIALIVMCLSTVAFAETCFQSDSLVPRYYKVSDEICVSSFGLKLVNPGIPVVPYFVATAETSQGRLEQKITFFESRTAPFIIKLSKQVAGEPYSTCDDINQTFLDVEFEVDANGQAVKKDPKVSLRHESSSDSCHSDTETTVIKFSRI